MKRLMMLIVLLGAFAFLFTGESLHAQDTEDAPDIETIFLQQFEAIEAGDLDASLEYIGEDTVGIALPPPPNTSPYTIGVEAYRGFNGYLIGQNADYEILEMEVSGNTINARFHLTEDLFRSVGVFPIEFSGSAVVDNGMLVSETWIMDPRDDARLSAAIQRQANLDVVHRFYEEFWNEGNLSIADEIVSPDFEDGFSGQIGIEPLKGYVQLFRTAFPNMEITYEDAVVDGDVVVANLTTNLGEYQGGLGDIFGVPDSAIGNDIVLRGIDYHRVEDGKIVAGWGTRDMLDWLQQFNMKLVPIEE